MNRKSQKMPTIEELNQRLKKLENMNVEQTLATLDKGSPKLNWTYLLLAMIAIFALIWIGISLIPGEDVDEYTNPNDTQIEQLEQQINDLEKRVEALENE